MFYIFKGVVMKLFMSKKRKAKALDQLKASVSLMKRAEQYSNGNMAFAALMIGVQAATDLGFCSIAEAKKHYNI